MHANEKVFHFRCLQSEGEVAPNYVFELTTSEFSVREDGALVVAVPDLDRDPPNRPELTFQVIAREATERGAASSPQSINVRLLDINDNKPTLPVVPTIHIAAGNTRRKVLKVRK